MNFHEHHAEKSTVTTTEERSKLFRKVAEPTLQRELKHTGAVSSDGSYAAELVGYIEIAGRPE
jgi:hypothetical protein